MENLADLTPEEIEKMLEKAKKDAQAMLDKLTPEERAQAVLKAKQAIEEDRAAVQKLIDDAAAVRAGDMPNREDVQSSPRFCRHCGAQAGAGKFCEYCGQPLESV